jgi:RHS repeat-associated protein
VDLTVRNPSNGFVTSLFASAPTAFRDVFTLAVTGTYTITVDPRDQQTGSLTFLLADASSGGGGGGSLTLADRFGVDSSAVDVSTAFTADRISEMLIEAVGTGPAALAAASTPELTISVADLLANDRPGPANESSQSLTVTGVAESPFTHGSVTFGAGIVTYVPDADFVGAASFTYTACDDGTTNGAPDPKCSTIQVVVMVTANHPPVVTGQSVTTAEETPVQITLTGSDPDGDPIVFVVGAPGRGQITGVPPSVTYTPAPDANGTDTFTFTANDGHDQSLPAKVTITVTAVNDPPVPKPDTATSGTGQPTTVSFATLLANDGPGPFDEGGQALAVTAVSPGADTHGSVQTSATSLTYTPDPAFDGTAVIAYTVCDNGSTNGNPDPKCADSTVSIGHNQPPTATAQSAQTSRTTPIDLTLTATDPEDDALTFAIATPPQHGTLSGTPPTVRYKASAGFIDTDTFTFTASDAFSTSSPATVTITVNDVPSPTLAADSATVQPGSSVLIAVLANDTPGSGALDPATMTIAASPSRGVAVVEGTQVRYTPNVGQTGADSFAYTVCDTGGGCATAQVSIVISENHAPVAADDTYDVNAGTTLNVAVPGVLANDSDADPGDRIQAHLVRGVTNGNLLLYGTGAFTYTPHGPGIDTFVYHVVDRAGLVSDDVTVTLVVTGPPGPPIVGNNLYQVQQGRELAIAAPGVLENDISPNPRLALTVLLQRDAAKGSLVLQPDGSFVYTPLPGYTGIDQFSYVVRDSEGRVSQEGRVGITVTAGGPATATVGSTTPADGSVVLGPTQFTATLVPPAGEAITGWTVSYRRPGGATLIPLASGAGTNVVANFDPTLVRDGTYSIVIRAVTSGGGVLVNETGLIVDGEYKPGRYTTTYRDVALNSANIPIELLRTYDSTNKAAGDLGSGWSLELANFRIESNGPLGAGRWTTFTCGSFPFLATCYQPSKPHIVTVTWPDGHVERFRFVPNQGSQLVPTITTAGFTAEPGSTSTLQPVGNGLLLSGGDFLLGDFFSSDGIYDPVQFVLTDRFGYKYTLDRRAGLLRIVDLNGNTVSLGSDGIATSSGLSMNFTRDANNRITRIASAAGHIDYTYSAAGDLVAVTYPNGTTQTFTYDVGHNLLTVSGGGDLVRTLQYDSEGRVTSVTDGTGATTAIDSDVAGRQQITTDPTGALTTVTTYNERGDAIRRDRVFGGRTITTTATYDQFGRQLTATDALGHTTSKTYDVAGDVLTEVDGSGHTTRYTYNSLGQILTTTDPTNRVTTNTYDAHGNLLTEVLPGGATTTYVYNGNGLLVSQTDPANRTTTYTYSAAGYPTSATDAAGNATHQVVDPSTGWLKSVTDRNAATISLSYDANGNVTGITDARGHTQTFTYDDFGRTSSISDPLGATLHRNYDLAGNLVSVTDRTGAVVTYVYDRAGRLTSKSVPGSGTSTYTYDPLGRLVAADNAASHLSFTYDDADNVLTATSSGTAAAPQPAVTLTYTYDAANRRTSVTGPGGTTSFGFDDANRVTTVGDAAGGTFHMAYDARGLLTTMSRPNGIADSLTYAADGRVVAIESRLGGSLVGQSAYTYDAIGRRASLSTPVGVSNFGYDPGSRLTSASYPSGAGIPAQLFGYDPTGNRTSKAGVPVGTLVYDNGNRLLSDESSNFTYDAEGNTLSRTVRATGATTVYTWSAEHQLLSIGYPDGSSSSFRYDPLGRRIEINDAGTVARFVYDEDSVAAIYDSAGSLDATFTYDGVSNTSHLEMTRAGARYFYLSDALGSTTALTRLDGTVANTYSYDAFGSVTRTGTVPNPFTFTGQLGHDRSGLVMFPVRAYEPSLGRFISQDPVYNANPYPYVANDPVNKVDPTGASIGGIVRGGIACAALVLGAMNANPAGSAFYQNAGDCTKEVLEAIAKRKELEEAQAIVRAQLAAEK